MTDEHAHLVSRDTPSDPPAHSDASSDDDDPDCPNRFARNSLSSRASSADSLTRMMPLGAAAAHASSVTGNDHGNDDADRTDVDVGARAHRPSWFVWILTFTTCISGLLFGYDTGVISATLVSLGTTLSNREMTSLDLSIITSSTSLFALILSPFSSFLGDLLGRRRVIILADVLFIVGALTQAIAKTVAVMVVGRCIVGAGIGAASYVVPLYIAEIAPAAHRGRLVTTNVLFITMGQVVAYIVGYIFTVAVNPNVGWRYMVGLGGVPSIIQLALVFILPETPRWLVMKGRKRKAVEVILRVMGEKKGEEEEEEEAGGEQVDPSTTFRRSKAYQEALTMVGDIEVEYEEEKRARQMVTGDEAGHLPVRKELWRTLRALIFVDRNRRALAIACLLQGLQQLCGFNSLCYFAATIFKMVGFDQPTLVALSVAVTNFVFTLVAFFIIDRVGRRRVLLWSIPFMIVGLAMACGGFEWLGIHYREGAEEDLRPRHPEAGKLILVSMMVYVASYAIGIGNVPWMQSELFVLNVRSMGSGISTATNWASNFVIGLTFLPLMEAIQPSRTFAIFLVVCGLGWTLIYLIYPETTGLSLEETSGLLEHGWGVKESRRRRARASA